jgi:hypothetical protein
MLRSMLTCVNLRDHTRSVCCAAFGCEHRHRYYAPRADSTAYFKIAWELDTSRQGIVQVHRVLERSVVCKAACAQNT